MPPHGHTQRLQSSPGMDNKLVKCNNIENIDMNCKNFDNLVNFHSNDSVQLFDSNGLNFCSSKFSVLAEQAGTCVSQLQFLLSIHQSSSQPNISAIVLPLMLLRSGMTSLKMFVVQHQLPPSERNLKHTCLQKPTHHSLPRHICVSLVRPGYVP